MSNLLFVEKQETDCSIVTYDRFIFWELTIPDLGKSGSHFSHFRHIFLR